MLDYLAHRSKNVLLSIINTRRAKTILFKQKLIIKSAYTFDIERIKSFIDECKKERRKILQINLYRLFQFFNNGIFLQQQIASGMMY